MKIAVGSDHAGYELKQSMARLLEELGHGCSDLGAFTNAQPAEDYPLIAVEVAETVAEGRADFGILMCGTGIGMSIAANKVPGARAALCNDLFTARKSREHNDANVLVIGARVVGEDLAKEIVRAWLETSYSGGRHARRNALLKKIEEKYSSRE